ncbi:MULTISPECIES: hypothetical protein [Pseudomonas]|uniref:hypothetical protein n=1 Tax=Pseudomonas TaxID=286 RepID=UPI001655068F|nr:MULTISPECIES: hypothetical protein [Pseudomonas]MBC8800973.1 hypothetical protein [Pseudomonas congelans]
MKASVRFVIEVQTLSSTPVGPGTTKFKLFLLFVEVASSRGFEVLEMLSPDKQFERYFQGREDGLSPTPDIHLMHLVTM